MENIEESEMIYEEAKEKISNLEINQVLKENLNNFNEKINKLKKYNIDFDVNIVIENCSKENIAIMLENISYIMNKYKTNKEFIKYSDIDEINDKKKTPEEVMIVIDNYEYFLNDKNKESYDYRTFIKLTNTYNIILTCEGCAEDLYKDLLKKNYQNIINNAIFIYDKTNETEEIVEKLKIKYKENNLNCEVDNELLKQIIEYYINKKICYKANCLDYLYILSTKNMLFKNLNSITPVCFNEYFENNKNEDKDNLEDLIGLQNIKKEIESLENFLNFKKKSKKKFDKTYLNMFFMGSPGTGKTTIARIIANILYKLEYLESNKIVEIIPTDLMANYIGQTKDKTREILKNAKGGLLFIDEAYLICQAKGKYGDGYKSYMNEALVELLKYLEDPKNIVIFAGYPEEMKQLYECNPGLKSRIYKEIYFDDYKEDELYLILEQKLKNMDMKVNNKAKNKIKSLLKEVCLEKNFGNARFCEQYAQKLIINHANRKLENENFIITLEDISEIDNTSTKKMGFIGD